MTGRDVHDVLVILRLDPLLVDDGTGCTILMHSEPPVIAVRDVYRVHRRKLANLILGLLQTAQLGAGDALIEFDRNRARPSGDLDPNLMGPHGIAFLNERADRSRSEWYWAGYRDGRTTR